MRLYVATVFISALFGTQTNVHRHSPEYGKVQHCKTLLLKPVFFTTNNEVLPALFMDLDNISNGNNKVFVCGFNEVRVAYATQSNFFAALCIIFAIFCNFCDIIADM